MTTGIYHGGVGIPRSRITAFVRSLGYDPSRVTSVTLSPWHVSVSVVDFIESDGVVTTEHEHPITPEDDAPTTIGADR